MNNKNKKNGGAKTSKRWKERNLSPIASTLTSRRRLLELEQSNTESSGSVDSQTSDQSRARGPKRPKSGQDVRHLGSPLSVLADMLDCDASVEAVINALENGGRRIYVFRAFLLSSESLFRFNRLTLTELDEAAHVLNWVLNDIEDEEVPFSTFFLKQTSAVLEQVIEYLANIFSPDEVAAKTEVYVTMMVRLDEITGMTERSSNLNEGKDE